MRTVEKIMPTRPSAEVFRLKRVTAYTRVSCGKSGTGTKKRKGFTKMIEDALAGKIDLILTKSVSRFARNTVDTLTTVRKLKEIGCEVFFEKENIFTLDSKGELLITIMSSLAQEESRSISENVRWGVRRRFEDGKVSMAYKHFLGYEKGPDGTPVIVEEDAELVRLIYRLFIYGKSPNYIASMLTGMEYPRRAARRNGVLMGLSALSPTKNTWARPFSKRALL